MSMFRNLMGAGLRRRDPLHGIRYVLDLDAHGRSNGEDEPVRSTWTDRRTGKAVDLHNFSFGGGSGWNGYAQDFKGSKWRIDSARAELIDSHTAVIYKGSSGIQFYKQAAAGESIEMRVRITGVTQDILDGSLNSLYIYCNKPDILDIKVRSDGVYDIHAYNEDEYVLYFFAIGDQETEFTTPVTIEQLPLYPGALVFDGVDDYGVTREAVTEQVGTVLAMYRMLSLKDSWHYLLDTRNDTGADRLYIGSNSSTSLWVNTTIAGFKPSTWPYDTALNIQSSVGSAAIAAPVMVSGSKVDSLQPENVALYRLILIREQLTDEQARLLRERVLAEHNAWLADNGYDDYIEDIAI